MAVAEKCDRSGIDREGPLPHKGERGPFRIKENCTAAISLGVAVPWNQKLHRRSATEWTVRPPEIHRLHNRMLSRKLRPSLGHPPAQYQPVVPHVSLGLAEAEPRY